jgi:hypothetical protein
MRKFSQLKISTPQSHAGKKLLVLLGLKVYLLGFELYAIHHK